MGTTADDLFLTFDRTRPRALRVQIEDGLRAAIRAGRLVPGTVVPSTRALAADLGITRKVVVEAYDQLTAEGYLVARTGAGTIVNDARTTAPRSPTVEQAKADIEVDFRPGRPDLDLFPRTAWSRATRSALQTLPTAELADDDRRGLPRLRALLAEHLARVRGVAADPDQIIVCSGFGHALDLAMSALVPRGPVAVENPGYPGVREQLRAMGIPFDGIGVDHDGLLVGDLRRSPARLVVVTPAHQSPTGVVLSSERRRQLVDWARDVDGYVIEDDYDAEYRYDRRPVGALHGLAPDRVLYCGTTSKTLASGLRIGWLVVPHDLVEPALARRRVTDGSTSTLLQATYATFLSNGDLQRHLRRSRQIYRVRRDAVITHLRRLLPELTPSGVSAGLNVLVNLPPGTVEADVVARALAAGVRVYPLAAFRIAPAPTDPPGLVLGYGSVRPEDAERGVRMLASVL